MRQPRSRGEERLGHCRGEALRGCGYWPAWGVECALEPPFELFDYRGPITPWDLCLNGWEVPYQGQFIDRLKRFFQPVYAHSFDRYYKHAERSSIPTIIHLRHYADDEVTYSKAEQFLLALSAAAEPVTFELFGIGESSHEFAGVPRIEVRFAASEIDVPLIQAQLHAHYPRSAVTANDLDDDPGDSEWADRLRGGKKCEDPVFVAPLQLALPYCFPLRTYQTFETDPLGVLLAVLDELGKDEWAVLQVTFQRATHPWAENLRMACEDPYRPGQPIDPALDLRDLNEKLDPPLFACTLTLAANTPQVFSRLTAWPHQYQGKNQLLVRDGEAWTRQWDNNDNPPSTSLWRDVICFRETLAPGMLLNARELAGVVHLPHPDLPFERLLRVQTQTRRPPKAVLGASLVVLGENDHRGEVQRVAIPPEVRARHCYIAGASGSGKSTLLLHMILQDIDAGNGVGLLDPHGDLVSAVLRHMPAHRMDDVILFDPSDKEHPFALNILDAADEAEQERIVHETVMALERYFPSSWGPRLERILMYTIHTVLDAIPDATLADVERMLTEEAFRREVLAKTKSPRLLQFWHTQFTFFPKNAVDPVLNKISPFLLNRTVRNIICQRKCAIDFDSVLNDGKILLANLSSGLLTEKISGMLGSFLVTKIVNAAFRRAAMPEEARRPWFAYIDEFQAFMNLSVGFERILAEARKYKFVLAGLANQYVGQLSTAVRQAVFGNVASFVIFRLGIDDARTVAQELGAFTADDILNLSVGEAIARVGPAISAFNLRTYPPPEKPTDDPTDGIINHTRSRFTKPRKTVEMEIGSTPKQQERMERTVALAEEAADPMEDDLVK